MTLGERWKSLKFGLSLSFEKNGRYFVLITLAVMGAGSLTYFFVPTPSYQTMISILTVLVQITGVLISFTAVVAVQILVAYRTQLDRAHGSGRTEDEEKVTSQRKQTLGNIRAVLAMFIISILLGVIAMAQLSPERPSKIQLILIFGLLYGLFSGIMGTIFLILEDL